MNVRLDSQIAKVELTDEGLTDLPRHIPGVSVAIHVANRQWQGYYPGRTSVSGVYGGVKGLSPKHALLQVIQGVLQMHLEACPKDKLYAKQLKRVQEALE